MRAPRSLTQACRSYRNRIAVFPLCQAFLKTQNSLTSSCFAFPRHRLSYNPQPSPSPSHLPDVVKPSSVLPEFLSLSHNSPLFFHRYFLLDTSLPPPSCLCLSTPACLYRFPPALHSFTCSILHSPFSSIRLPSHSITHSLVIIAS